MKKNLIPLLAIAFVVALIATGIFYGLVVSQVSAGTEPAAKVTPGSEMEPLHQPAQPLIPVGMRAVSVQVADSSGVLAMLKEGDKVDVQAVYTRSQSGQMALKTILQSLQVLRFGTHPEPSPGKPALPVVTLLVTPGDADVLAVADATARLRLSLRNPNDKEKAEHSSIALTNAIQGSDR